MTSALATTLINRPELSTMGIDDTRRDINSSSTTNRLVSFSTYIQRSTMFINTPGFMVGGFYVDTCHDINSSSTIKRLVPFSTYIQHPTVIIIEQCCNPSICWWVCLSHSLGGCTVCPCQTATGKWNFISPWNTSLYPVTTTIMMYFTALVLVQRVRWLCICKKTTRLHSLLLSVSLALLFWSYSTLGKNFSDKL